MSIAITEGVRIEVRSRYIPERSDPDGQFYFFAYRVQISNEGDEPIQLVSRHWIITDGNSKVEQVRGPGVVGEQPLLRPGESFEYVSGCPLRTPVGSMHGTFQMVAENREFDAEVAPFTLALPNILQ